MAPESSSAIPPWFLTTQVSAEIFASDTMLGEVSARRSPAFYPPRGSGIVRIENEVYVEFAVFRSGCFEDAVERAFRVREFFELLAGRPQNFSDFRVHKKMSRELRDYYGTNQEDGQEAIGVYTVYGTLFPRYKRYEGELRPDPSSVLLKPFKTRRNFPAC